jgi:hypothetical protein
MSFAALSSGAILSLAAALTVIATLCWALYPGPGGAGSDPDAPVLPGQSMAASGTTAGWWQARGAAEVLARLGSSRRSAFVALSWEWVLRANGQVAYRLATVDGRAERNPWTPVTQLAATDLPSLRQDRAQAAALLADLARQHGHEADRQQY